MSTSCQNRAQLINISPNSQFHLDIANGEGSYSWRIYKTRCKNTIRGETKREIDHILGASNIEKDVPAKAADS